MDVGLGASDTPEALNIDSRQSLGHSQFSRTMCQRASKLPLFMNIAHFLSLAETLVVPVGFDSSSGRRSLWSIRFESWSAAAALNSSTVTDHQRCNRSRTLSAAHALEHRICCTSFPTTVAAAFSLWLFFSQVEVVDFAARQPAAQRTGDECRHVNRKLDRKSDKDS
jgi:hypothetical protein